MSTHQDLTRFYGLENDARRKVYLADGRSVVGRIAASVTTNISGAITLHAVQVQTDDSSIIAIPLTGITSVEAVSA